MVAQAVEIVTHGSCQGQQVLNRFHFLDTDGVADPAVLCADFTTHFVTPLLAGISTGFTIDQLLYTVVYPTIKLQHSYGTGYPKSGAVPFAAGPNIIAGSVKYNLGDTLQMDGTAALFHIKRGGKRIGGLLVEAGENDVFNDAGQRGAINNAMAGLVAFAPDAWQFVVLRFPPDAAPVPPSKLGKRLPPIGYAPVTGFVLKGTFGSQVSRKPGHGR